MTSANKYLYDTSVFIHFMRGVPAAKTLIEDAVQSTQSASYSIITEVELWHGVSGVKDAKRHKQLLRPFSRLDLNVVIARRAGGLLRQHYKDGVRVADAIIAATAIHHNLIVVTSNKKHFEPLLPQLKCLFYNHTKP